MITRASSPLFRRAPEPRRLLVAAILRLAALGIAGTFLSSIHVLPHLVVPALADQGGHGAGHGHGGESNGKGNGNGNGSGQGNGDGSGNAQRNGNDNGNGSGQGNGNDN